MFSGVNIVVSTQTVEAERISVDHVAHIKPSDGGSAATQCKSSTLLSSQSLLFQLCGSKRTEVYVIIIAELFLKSDCSS